MKRPGGFDGGSDPDPPAPPVTQVSPATPVAPVRLRRPRPARTSEPQPSSVPQTPADDRARRTVPVGPAETEAPDEDLNATVPLDEVRRDELPLAESPRQDPPREGGGADERTEDGSAHELSAREADVQEARRRLRDAERSRRRRERGEQRRFTEHLRRRRRGWAVAGLAVLGLALFVAVGVLTPLMAVREVKIVGASQVNAVELEAAMSRFEGVPLALVNDQEVHRALEPFPLIERYAVERIPPQTLVLRIEEREAVIAVERDGRFALYDPAGVLIGTAAERPEGVPLAGGTVLDTQSPAFRAAAQVVRDMPGDLRPGLAAVEATTPQEVSFVLTGGTQVIWGGAEDTQRKAVVLRSMISSLGFVTAIDVSAPDTPVFK